MAKNRNVFKARAPLGRAAALKRLMGAGKGAEGQKRKGTGNGHTGRIAWFTGKERWEGLKGRGRIRSSRTVKGKTATERRFFPAGPGGAAQSARRARTQRKYMPVCLVPRRCAAPLVACLERVLCWYAMGSRIHTSQFPGPRKGLKRRALVREIPEGQSINRPAGTEDYRANYRQHFYFDNLGLGNMTRKTSGTNNTVSRRLGDPLDYSLDYEYEAGYAHRASRIGTRYYQYDLNGTVTAEREGPFQTETGTGGEVRD
jgi:hypothetical protein